MILTIILALTTLPAASAEGDEEDGDCHSDDVLNVAVVGSIIYDCQSGTGHCRQIGATVLIRGSYTCDACENDGVAVWVDSTFCEETRTGACANDVCLRPSEPYVQQ